MPTEYQKELFEEFKKEKGKFEKIAEKWSKTQPTFHIYVPLENIVLTAIIFIMCIIAAFALGVERGKRTLSLRPQEKNVTREREKLPSETEIAIPQVETKIREAESNKKTGFAIQLISYNQKHLAEGEKNRLLNKKMDAFIISSGKWHKVCVGGYLDLKEAQKALKEFKKEYEDCFIRTSNK